MKARNARAREAAAAVERPDPLETAHAIAAAAEPLPRVDDPEFAAAFDRYADRRVVLLGEASHGTCEFYRARAAITRRLIERHGFAFVAVEADWPDASAIDRYVRGRPRAASVEPPFRRFPTWMWRNVEVAELVEWLRSHNERLAEPASRAGFHGLDLYNLRASIAAVIEYLDAEDPGAAKLARERYGCLAPWEREPASYAYAAEEGGDRCEAAVIAQCCELLDRHLQDSTRDGDDLLDAAHNARLVASAERYYRTMYRGGAESWNLRDTHMFETLRLLLEARGPAAKAVVWAHNSHIGDARATEMGWLRGELNLGQLCREHYGEAAACIGFGTHAGTVAAADDWEEPMRVMRVRDSLAGSCERVCHDAGLPRFLLDFAHDRAAAARARLAEPHLERFIGVIYRPSTERMSHYADAAPSRQFDAYVWFDETTAVTPLGAEPPKAGVPDTYPFAT